MARLGRRQPFKPIMNRLIAYLPPVPPIGGKFIVSSAQHAASRYSSQYNGGVTINTLIQYLPLPPTDPVGKQYFVQAAQISAKRYRSKLSSVVVNLVPPNILYPPPIGRHYVVSRGALFAGQRKIGRPHGLFLSNYLEPQVITNPQPTLTELLISGRSKWRTKRTQ